MSSGWKAHLKLKLRRFDPSRTHYVRVEKGGGLGASVRLQQIENMEMLDCLFGKAAAINGDVVFDKPSQPIDALDGVEKEFIAGAGHEHFMKVVVSLEYLCARPMQVPPIAECSLNLPRLPENLRNWVRSSAATLPVAQ